MYFSIDWNCYSDITTVDYEAEVTQCYRARLHEILQGDNKTEV